MAAHYDRILSYEYWHEWSCVILTKIVRVLFIQRYLSIAIFRFWYVCHIKFDIKRPNNVLTSFYEPQKNVFFLHSKTKSFRPQIKI